MTGIVTLNNLFEDMLKDIYYAEKQILKALPKMIKKLGKESDLAKAFEKHLKETEGQVTRLEKVFKIIGRPVKGKTCAAIEGLIEEAGELMKNVKCQATLEAGLLAGAQAVEHYEIARYGTLIEWATLLGYESAVELLEETITQEKNTDEALTELAKDEVNERAYDVLGEEDEGREQHKRAA